MTSCVHKICRRTYGQTNMKRALTLAKINHPWNWYNMRMLRSWPTKLPNMNKMRQKTSCIHKMCGRTYGKKNMKRATTLAKINHPVWPYVHSHILCTQLVICLILFIFGILIGHDLGMRILCRFHGWLIFARVVALFMFFLPYVRPHILCMQLVFCRILFIFGNLVGHDLSMRILYQFHGWLIHPWNRHNMRMPRSWPIKIPNMNKMRQMTSCVHKMCEWTYGQTNMKRAITLAKIIHPWNRYTMWMLTLWPTKIPNMNKIKQKTND
jgi:hypothetical protein